MLNRIPMRLQILCQNSKILKYQFHPVIKFLLLFQCHKEQLLNTWSVELYPLLHSEVVRKPCLKEMTGSPRLRMEAIMFSCQAWNFSRFRVQDEHNASFIIDKMNRSSPLRLFAPLKGISHLSACKVSDLSNTNKEKRELFRVIRTILDMEECTG